MDSKDPDSGYPTPRDDAEELNETTQSQFIPMVTSTPKVTTHLPRLNLHTRSDADRLSEEDEEYFSPDDEQTPSAELVKNKIQQEMMQRELDKTKSKFVKLQRENEDLKSERSRLQTSLDTSVAVVDDKDATIEELNKSLSILNETISTQNDLIQKQMENHNTVTAASEVLNLSKEEIERELVVVASSNNKYEKELKAKDERIHQLEDELNEAQCCANREANQSTRVSSSLAVLDQQLEATQQDLEELKAKYERDQQVAEEKYGLLSETLEQSECERQQLEKRIKTNLQDTEELTRQNDELQNLIAKMKKKESFLEDQVRTLQNDVSEYKKNSDDWKFEADQCKTYIATLEKKRTELSTEVCAKTTEISQLTMDFEKLQVDFDEATENLSLQTSELDILKQKELAFLKEIERMKHVEDRKNIVEDEINSKNIILKEQEESIEKLRAKVVESKAKSIEFEASRTDFLARIKILTEANERAKATVEKARQVETQLINDQVHLRTEVSAMKNEVDNLQRVVTKTKESERMLRDQLNGEHEIAELLTEEKNKNCQLSDKLGELEKINRGLVDENDYLRSEFGNRPHIEEMARFQQEMQQKTIELEKMKKSEREFLELRERLNTELLALKEDFKNKETVIEGLLDDIQVANDEIAKQKNIIGKLVKEHNDFEEDVHRREAEFDAAQIRLQELEALDGYPGRSVEIDTCDVAVNTSMNYESQKAHMEIVVRENDSLRSTLDNERQRAKELTIDLRKSNKENRDLSEKLNSIESKLCVVEKSVQHFRHECSSLQLLLADRDSQLRTFTAESSINKLALSEMKRFLTVDYPRDIHELEDKIRVLDAQVERLNREKIGLQDEIENKDERVVVLSSKVRHLQHSLQTTNSEYLRTRKLLKISLGTHKELLKKMEDQDFFIERIRNRNSDRQLVIDTMEKKLKKAYIELGREPNWGKVPQKKGRWVREEAEEEAELTAISNEMQSISCSRDTEMIRSSRHIIAEEPKSDSRDTESLRETEIDNALSESSIPRSFNRSLHQYLMASPVMDKENQQEKNTASEDSFNSTINI